MTTQTRQHYIASLKLLFSHRLRPPKFGEDHKSQRIEKSESGLKKEEEKGQRAGQMSSDKLSCGSYGCTWSNAKR